MTCCYTPEIKLMFRVRQACSGGWLFAVSLSSMNLQLFMKKICSGCQRTAAGGGCRQDHGNAREARVTYLDPRRKSNYSSAYTQ